MSRLHEAKSLVQHELCYCKCVSNESVFNSKQE